MAEVRKGQNLAQLGNFASANGLNFEDIAEFYGVNIAKHKCPGISSSNTSNGEQPQEEIEIIPDGPTENDQEMATEEPEFQVVRLRKPDKPRPAKKPEKQQKSTAATTTPRFKILYFSSMVIQILYNAILLLWA